MEASQPLSIESFSYSWLINLKPSFESLDDSLRTSLDVSDEASSFIEMDPRMPPSKRFFRNSQDFNFDFPISQRPLVHADELFSNGLIMPLFMEPLKMQAYHDSSYSLPATPISSSHAPKHELSASNSRCPSLRRCRRLSKRILQKYLDFLRPLYRRIRGGGGGGGGGGRAGSRTSRAKNVNSRMEEMKSCAYSPEASPRTSTAYSNGDWRRSCDSESSIYEAVLHCKRSIGK